jgi:hypothetical protein
MPKIAIVSEELPFMLSEQAVMLIRQRHAAMGRPTFEPPDGTFTAEYRQNFSQRIDRSDAALISAIEKLGPAASHEMGNIKIVRVPDGKKWRIIQVAVFEFVIGDNNEIFK